ncbi:dihydroorotase family protein [Oscillibacter sp. MSJ-2]|uniref:Dihydroorotase family protein n=1 Tax=Dysosmobacter acutus TaxID=2841504 RepID=A0ABS6FCV0_9FIRM|nr:dihydroorotase family protein [Dysosmobacter acutus]MBU5628113.1 dihydroorotase family protein [Dysosmobacter acutus]
MEKYDLLIKNGDVVLADKVEACTIAVKDGRIAAVSTVPIDDSEAAEVLDAKGLTVMPGAVDCHTHLGIYAPLDVDTASETKAALTGGVTTMMSYFRTGAHYMNKTGPYHEIFKEALELTAGNAYCDYCFHLAPMDDLQVGEMEWLVEQGVVTFKYFMFYKGLNLGANSTVSPTMSDCYDLGHLYNIMAEAARLNTLLKNEPVSVSVHCEDDEIIKSFIKRVNAAGLEGMQAYCEARPPLSERIAILKAGSVANATGAKLNVLHITSAEAMQATRDLLKIYPDIKLRRECTLHALGLTWEMLQNNTCAKVNPPLRTAADNAALWEALAKGEINWVGSDHANTPIALKPREDMWGACCGFGGTSLIYPFMISEGHFKHGLSLPRIAELVSSNPAKAHAAWPKKGSMEVGADADFALIDLNLEKTVHAGEDFSAQEYTVFEGVSLKGWPVATILRGRKVYEAGKILGAAAGEYVKRPC